MYAHNTVYICVYNSSFVAICGYISNSSARQMGKGVRSVAFIVLSLLAILFNEGLFKILSSDIAKQIKNLYRMASGLY